MQLPIFEKYIDELIEKSTLDVPAWNQSHSLYTFSIRHSKNL